jgi:hypothetical protein
MRGLQFEYWYNHEVIGADGPYALDPHGIYGNGFYLAGTLFDVIGLGISLEALNPAGSASYRKTHLTLAFSPTRAFSTAFGFNLFGSSDHQLAYLNGLIPRIGRVPKICQTDESSPQRCSEQGSSALTVRKPPVTPPRIRPPVSV